MKPFSFSCCKTRPQRGFNLIEVAVVLGVVGLVGGGIWVAAAALKEQQAEAEIVSGVLRITTGVREYYRNFDLPNPAITSMKPLIIAAKLAPQNWIKSTTLVQTPYGHSVDFWVQSQALNTLSIGISPLPKSLCMRLMTRFSAPMAESPYNIYLMRILAPVDSGVILRTSFPISMENSDIYCSSSTNNRLEISFFVKS